MSLLLPVEGVDIGSSPQEPLPQDQCQGEWQPRPRGQQPGEALHQEQHQEHQLQPGKHPDVVNHQEGQGGPGEGGAISLWKQIVRLHWYGKKFVVGTLGTNLDTRTPIW